MPPVLQGVHPQNVQTPLPCVWPGSVQRLLYTDPPRALPRLGPSRSHLRRLCWPEREPVVGLTLPSPPAPCQPLRPHPILTQARIVLSLGCRKSIQSIIYEGRGHLMLRLLPQRLERWGFKEPGKRLDHSDPGRAPQGASTSRTRPRSPLVRALCPVQVGEMACSINPKKHKGGRQTEIRSLIVI